MIETKLDVTELTIYEKVLCDNSVFFDIGARMNLHEYLDINKTHEFHLFEPNPQYFEKLSEYVDRFRISNPKSKIIANNVAISNFTSNAHTYYWHGSESIIDLGRVGPSDFTVKVIKLQEYIENSKIKKIDYIKIDTEGSDYVILESSYDTIRKLKVPYIQFEYWDKIEQFYSLLHADYNLYLLNESVLANLTGYRDSIIPLESSLVDIIHSSWIPSGWGGNILAVDKSINFDCEALSTQL
jgi:FkbM family methyltransferase